MGRKISIFSSNKCTYFTDISSKHICDEGGNKERKLWIFKNVTSYRDNSSEEKKTAPFREEGEWK